MLVWAAVSDVRHRRIPNWTVLCVLVLFIPWALAATLNWSLWAVVAGVIAFAASFVLYAAGVIGAGDSKLFSATALLAGMGHLALLAVLTAVIGGIVAIGVLLSRPTRTLVLLNMRGKGDFGRGVPYGVAIAAGAVAILWIETLRLVIPGL